MIIIKLKNKKSTIIQKKNFNKLLNEYNIFYDDFTKNKDANNFEDYNPNKFNRSRRYDNRSFESTEEQPRTSTPNEEEVESPDQGILRELGEAAEAHEFLLYDEGNGTERLSYIDINNYVRGAVEENDLEIRNRDIIVMERALKDVLKMKNDNKRLVLLFKHVINLIRRSSAGRGLKILTPQQMLTRLPILLAQIQAGNNSQKLKNEARQLLYSPYKSKMITKTVYNTLIRRI